MYIAENLKALRKKKEWTQEEMAERLAVSPQSVSKWERGDTYPDITLLPALANLYKVSVDFIIGMDRINEDETRKAIFVSGHELLRSGDGAAAAKVFVDALKTYPADESIMAELALVLALECDPEKLKQAADLFERVLMANPSEKVRHTTRAAICFVYFKLGDKEKAITAAGNLPHHRECRENVMAEICHEPTVADINTYIRFLALGERAQYKIVVEFGYGMIPVCTEHELTEKVIALRKELGAKENQEDVPKLPIVHLRDNGILPPNRVRVNHFAEIMLDRDFSDPAEAVIEIMRCLKAIAER